MKLNSLFVAAMVTTATNAQAGLQRVSPHEATLVGAAAVDCSKIDNPILRQRCQQEGGIALTAGPKALTDAEIFPEDFRVAVDAAGTVYFAHGSTLAAYRVDGALSQLQAAAREGGEAEVVADEVWHAEQRVIDVLVDGEGVFVVFEDGSVEAVPAEAFGSTDPEHATALTDLDGDGEEDWIVLQDGEVWVYDAYGGGVHDYYVGVNGGGGVLALTRPDGNVELYLP